MDLTDIIVDRREPMKIFSDLAFLLPDKVVMDELDAGDYSWFMVGDGKVIQVIIERMTWGNFLDKIKTGQLAAQMRRMVEGKSIVILLFEGELYIDGEDVRFTTGEWKQFSSKWRYSSIGDYLISLQMAGGVLCFSPDKDSTAKRIRDIYFYLAKEDHDSLHRPYRPIEYAFRAPTPNEELWMAVPGIGYDLAREIGKEVSVMEVLGSEEPVKLLSGIKGVGKGKANKILEVLCAKSSV